jgi:hypothetical protein
MTAKRWFNRGDGNTYHSVYVSVLVPVERANEIVANVYNRPLEDGTVWIDLAQDTFQYGYERGFDQTALSLFEVACTYPIPDCGTLSRFCKDMDIPLSENLADVNRKKDL